MIKEPRLSMFDLVTCLSNVIDLVNPTVVNHHSHVAYISLKLGEELGLPQPKQAQLAIAGLLHDVGALSLEERLESLKFDFANSQRHAERGYYFLRTFEPLRGVAERIRYHHVPWNYGEGMASNGEEVPFSSHILNLADRVAISTNYSKPILNQAEDIRKKIRDRSGSLFVPEIVEAFCDLGTREYFWFDLASPAPSVSVVMSETLLFHGVELSTQELIGLGNLIRRIIDFRAPFTASHSLRVASAAEALAGIANFSKREQNMIKVAGFLHDLGKLAVPAEILRKPGKLNEFEFNIVKSHTFHSYRALEPLDELHRINLWASFHHERMDGKGYPFKHKGDDLPLGSRIMSVADVFSALTEDRPYRTDMRCEDALKIVQNMAKEGALDPDIVTMLTRNADEVYSICMAAGISATQDYKQLIV
ncbi:MAG: HD domain-containing protein [Firmicutes bacterium]|nr:HD domain-containing protein [Bacillota bacterium]